MRILLTGTGYSDPDIARLCQAGYEVIRREHVSASDLREIIPTLEAYVLGGEERLDAQILCRADRLRLISFVGTGYGDFLDAAAAAERGIEIRNTPSIAGPAVAEHTLGLLLGLVRGLFAHNAAVKAGYSGPGASRELADIVVGIVGLGDIGSRVARILRHGFGTTVLYASRTRKTDLERELGLEHVDRQHLFASVDAVILLAPIAPATIGMVDAKLLEAARPGLFLINTAGARLVDPQALKRALDSGHVAAAAFDSYWIEPLPAPDKDPFGLLGLPDASFVVTPHVAAKTTGSWNRMLHLAVENVIAQTHDRA